MARESTVARARWRTNAPASRWIKKKVWSCVHVSARTRQLLCGGPKRGSRRCSACRWHFSRGPSLSSRLRLAWIRAA